MPLVRPSLRRAVVVVPVHDEAELLPACLAGLRAAAATVVLPVEVVVVLDACTDDSAFLVGHERAVVIDRRCVGAARAAGFAAADVDAATWCASTDADSVVGPSWLAAQLDLAAAGADVAVGTVVPAGWVGHRAGVRERFEAAYVRADGHRHVHGASLGVRGSTYLSLGGFAPLSAHEDVDLVRRAVHAGAEVRWVGQDAGMGVATSTRTVGRAPDGFAAHLRALAAGADVFADGGVRALAAGADVFADGGVRALAAGADVFADGGVRALAAGADVFADGGVRALAAGADVFADGGVRALAAGADVFADGGVRALAAGADVFADGGVRALAAGADVFADGGVRTLAAGA